jgi:hypothetical protein
VADIFVSYTSSDRDRAFWIGQELKKLGHIPHVHEWEIRMREVSNRRPRLLPRPARLEARPRWRSS